MTVGPQKLVNCLIEGRNGRLIDDFSFLSGALFAKLMRSCNSSIRRPIRLRRWSGRHALQSHFVTHARL